MVGRLTPQSLSARAEWDYARFAKVPSRAELERCFFLDDEDPRCKDHRWAWSTCDQRIQVDLQASGDGFGCGVGQRPGRRLFGDLLA
jgi:hypothetical protein